VNPLADRSASLTIILDALGEWLPDRPSTLVVACSDGRLQYATDDFLARHLGVTRYDRFYVPACAGYRRKLPWASVTELRARQAEDAKDLALRHEDWAGMATVSMYRCEVDERGGIRFVGLTDEAEV
jgi:hypothetical protein